MADILDFRRPCPCIKTDMGEQSATCDLLFNVPLARFWEGNKDLIDRVHAGTLTLSEVTPPDCPSDPGSGCFYGQSFLNLVSLCLLTYY